MMLAECDRTINAPLTTVWDLLTTAEGLTAWMATSAQVELEPGGVIRWEHDNGEVVAGQVVEVVPMARFVFTYGWESGFFPVPPGSTTVTVTLIAAGDSTRVSIRHDGLDQAMAARHDAGWRHYLDLLAARAERKASA